MKKLLLLILFLAALGSAFLGALYFTARLPLREQEPGSRATGPFTYSIPQGVKLSPEKENALKDLNQCYCLRRNELFARIDQKRLDLTAMLLHSDPDLLAVDRLVDDINSLQSDLEKQTIRHILATRDLLPAEKQKRFMESITQEVKRCCDLRQAQGENR